MSRPAVCFPTLAAALWASLLPFFCGDAAAYATQQPNPTISQVSNQRFDENGQPVGGGWSLAFRKVTVSQRPNGRTQFDARAMLEAPRDMYFIFEAWVYPAGEPRQIVNGMPDVSGPPVHIRSARYADFFVDKNKGGEFEIHYDTNLPRGKYKVWLVLQMGDGPDINLDDYTDKPLLQAITFNVP